MPIEDLEPEDRERLVRIKYGELFDECFKERFEAAFDARVKELYGASGKSVPEPQQSQQQSQQQRQTPRKRMSAFEAALAQGLGIK
jgi:hypothetical protein